MNEQVLAPRVIRIAAALAAAAISVAIVFGAAAAPSSAELSAGQPPAAHWG